ncbi:MAG: hypothetical protein GY821_12710 [Gammaproteobacteria bacterium]|nr:hypothetical protein [Gammaproteobacteria bacterium]
MEIVKLVLEESKKLGRILALCAVLGIAGTMSFRIGVENEKVLELWMDLVKLALMFYFITIATVNKKEQ